MICAVSERISDHQLVVNELERAGVRGACDFGYFANDTARVRPSTLDERAAMATLLNLLPGLTDPDVVASAAGHLRRPWARGVAFAPLLDAFRRFAPADPIAGWQLGDALVSVATDLDVPSLLGICGERDFGKARQMVVYAMWRFKKDDRVALLLTELLVDEDVCGHAASALRRTIGNNLAMPLLLSARDQLPNGAARDSLSRNVKKAAK